MSLELPFIELELNDLLYRAVSGHILRYKVYGIRKYNDLYSHYEIECLSCSHGDEHCKILVAIDDYNNINYMHMISEDEDYIKEHRCWHNAESHFFRTKEEALKDYKNRAAAETKKEIDRKERELKNLKDIYEIYNGQFKEI